MRPIALLIAGLAALAVAAPAQADTWNVTNGSSDATTPACNPDLHTCVSLRTAIAASEATKEVGDVINVPAGTININNDLVIQSDITVNGVSARSNIIDGGLKYRGFRVSSTGSAKINHFTIDSGSAGQGDSTDGGGILNQGGITQLSNVRVTASRAARGGGIANVLGVVTLQNVLVDGNTATGEGGGIANIGGPEVANLDRLIVADSTIFNNSSGRAGVGGISSRNAGSIVGLNRTTVADNVVDVSGVGGLGILSGGTLQVGASIVARNLLGSVSSNCGATKLTDAGANVENDKECDFDRGGGDPGLETELSNAGGEVNVLALKAASPAVDLAPLSNCNTAGTTDQRGMFRPQGPGCDAGAYELDQAATMTINSGPSGSVTSGDVQFNFSSNEPGVAAVCQLTGPDQTPGYVSCYKSNAQPYSGLANGAYTFSVRDGAFPSSTPATQTFTVAALETTIIDGPSGPTNDTTPTFTFTGTSAASFQCRFDTATFAACTSPFTPTAALGPGAHTFEVRAISAAGAPDPTPASRPFTIDLAPPDTTLTPITTPTNDSTPTFTFTSEAGASFQCRVDTAAFAVCTSPLTTATLSDGSHTFDVRAIDAVGNTDQSPASQTFIVDTTAPNTTLTPITSPTSDSTPTFTFTSEAGASFQCRVDTAAFAACTSPLTTAAFNDGSHTFTVRAIDALGNTDQSPATHTFIVDTTPPNTTLTPITTPTGDNTPTFTFTSEAGASFQCRVDAAAFAACTSPLTTAALNDGSHTFDVRALDALGNTDQSPATQTFVIDTGAPSTTIDNGPPALTNDATPTFTFSSDDTGSTFQCRIDGGAFTTCTSPLTTAALADGAHTFEVRATDSIGNRDGSAASRAFTVDATPPPAPAVQSGPEGVTTNSAPAFAFSAPEATGVTCKLDGPGAAAGSFGTCTSPKSFSALAPGNYVFFVRSVDAAGNEETTQRAFTVTVVQQGTPTPTPSATPTPTPSPTPVAGQSVGMKPVGGKVLIKLPGSNKFVPLDPSVIKNGAEVDTRNGVVEITRSDGGVAKFYDGIFKLSQSGGITTLTLTEKLTGCKTSKKKASAAAKKPKTRKLWGDGKGKFRTRGQYSAATVRGTKWLVQDTCTNTLTRVAQGVVAVEDFAKKKTIVVKKGKSYTARPKKK